jgi:hypothetical protein
LLRQGVHIPVLLLGVATGVAMYLIVRHALLEYLGAHVPWITGALTVGPIFVLAFRLAPRVSDALAARALPRWRASLARRYGLDADALAETTKFL